MNLQDSHLFLHNKIGSTEEAVRGRQYGPRPSIQPEKRRLVLTDLGRIDAREQPLKCFMVLLSD